MEIDQDLGNISFPKQKINFKPIVLGLLLVLVIITIIGFVLFILPEIIPKQSTIDTNEPVVLDNIPPQNCVHISSLEPTRQFAILANSNTTDSAVSLKGSKANYIMLYNGSTKEFIENPYKDLNDSSLLANWLKEQGVIGLVVGNVDNNFIYAVKQNKIECYKSTEIIKFFIKEVVPKQNYCTNLKNTGLKGIIALAANNETQEGIVSLEDYNAPYFQIYDGNNLLKIIDNPVVSGGTINSLIQILIDNNVSIVVAGTPREEFYTELIEKEITCVNSTEIISYVVSEIK